MVYRLVIAPNQQQQGQINLTPQQQHYLQRVLRLNDGDRFVAMDGQGQCWIAAKMGISAQIIAPLSESTELPVAITLIVALPKGNGFDQVVRCCTELGVASLVPAIAARTLLKPSSHKLQRWCRIAQEAAEQSERQIVPKIWEPVQFTTALEIIKEQGDQQTAYYICVARGDAQHLLPCLENHPSQQMVIATGPEGGWTPAEVEAAIAAGFEPVSLGSRILRAVTAPIAALAVAAAVADRWSISH